MNFDFCVHAVQEELANYDTSEIFNIDRGSQFTSFDFTNGPKDAGIRISMDDKRGWLTGHGHCQQKRKILDTTHFL